MVRQVVRSVPLSKPIFSRSFQRYLTTRGILSIDQVVDIEKALNASDGTQSLAAFLVENNHLTEEELAKALSDHYQIPYISISEYEIDREILDSVSEDIARRYKIIPLDRTDKLLTVALVDPDNIHHLDEIKIKTRMDVMPVISLPKEIEAAIDKYYGKQESKPDETYASLLGDLEQDDIEVVHDQDDDLDGEGMESAPIIRLVNMLISEAIRGRTSDVHLEPEEKTFRVRYRIDGVLKEMPSIPKKMQNAVISRIKIISELDIAEKRKPQDGRFKMKLENRVVDFRVSIIPTVHGEKVVMRLLDKRNLQLDLSKLGFEPESLAKFERAIRRPYGMMIVTGPTGSGKSTTLYSALSRINDPGKNIMTAEDPVEYQIRGINQVQVRPEIGMGFPEVLRSFLRQDPDIIMIGEIRDLETASIAVKAALTGHFVLSTLHTNDAPSSLNRLVDMGLEPFLVGASLLLVVAQRLVRKVCPECKRPYQPTPELIHQLGLDMATADQLVFFEGKGCGNCNETGYRGRMALYEVMEMDEELSDAAIKGLSNRDIKNIARKNGMKTLRDSGIVKVLDGMTTVQEVLSTTYEN
ncbi:MAG: Type II secretion system protein E [Candidatus Hinthialibacteria bacterium OLB16]|nr:MAG: Type II secretion system protein E [Candidatus Hinthialibacteria bacterium OLB16]